MAKNANFVSHKKSKLKNQDGSPQLPSASALVEGEIAINFGKDVETLSIKNESGDVVTFSSDNYYSEKKLGSAFTGANSAVTVTEALEDIKIDVDQVIDSGTSASTNAVATKAVYKAITDNELVWTNAYVAMSGEVSAHTANTEIHVTAADKEKLHTHSNKSALDSITGNVGTMAYEDKASYSSATEVNAALGNKANTSDLADFFDDAKYEDSGTTKVINFYHGNTIKATIDASDFIVDGMVDDVRIENGNLVIDFNTASGKQDISIPLTDIFDPSNYYNKAAIDDLVGSGFTSLSITDVIIENEEIIAAALTDLDERKLDTSAYTPSVELWEAGSGSNSAMLKNGNNTVSGELAVAEGSGNTVSGKYAHAEGANNVASALYAHAEGAMVSATSIGTHAEGMQTLASDFHAHAEGSSTKATGMQSHAEGSQTKATGNQSHAEGASTQAAGNQSHAEGSSTIASGVSSHAEGASTRAYGGYSHVEGESTIASGSRAHAEGYGTKASGSSSHAEGYNTIASGDYSHTEGLDTMAVGDNGSHAEGRSTSATSYQAHAEGVSTLASGDYSHAEGNNTIANNNSEHASGRYNISSTASTEFGDSGNTLFSVGNGSYNARHNAFEIRQNGDIYITSGSTDIKLQDNIGKVEVISAITPSNSGSTAPIATKVIAENELIVSNALNDLNTAITAHTNALNDLNTAITAHTADTSIHVTQALLDRIAYLENKVIYNGHAYVDLGLPSGTKWAKYNVGANSETDYGNYYMYGMGSKTYDPTDSPYAGTEDPLAASADTAALEWGGSWHMPTYEQLIELTANTTYEWTTIDGINGGKFTAQNGNYVFFPAAGSWDNGSQDLVGSNGYYWSSSPGYGSDYAYILYFYNGVKNVDFSDRYYGSSVRPVVG